MCRRSAVGDVPVVLVITAGNSDLELFNLLEEGQSFVASPNYAD